MRTLAVILAIALTGPVLAANSDVPLPRERPASTAGASPAVPLPRERPEEATGTSSSSVAAPTPAPEPAAPPPAAAPQGGGSSQEPPAAESSSSAEPAKSIEVTPAKPPRDYQVGCPAVMEGKADATLLPPIHEGQCGIQSPLALSAVSANGRSVPLNATVTTDCGMASALPDWIADVDSYVAAHDQTRIKTVNLGISYVCRNVDNATDGNLSFHAFADAVDVVGFTLEDGRTISIDPGFGGTPEQGSQILHFARDAACTHFMTVLSPDSDSFHQNNMHIDLGCHGKTCTTRICE